jgi:hypothetical protein
LLRLRQLNADTRREKALTRADLDLAEGRVGHRRHALDRATALLSHGRETFEWFGLATWRPCSPFSIRRTTEN